LVIEGRSAILRVRLPAYELQHMANPAADMANAFALTISGAEATPAASLCRRSEGSDVIVCDLRFNLPAKTGPLTVRCTLDRAIVAHHVHVLQAARGEEQARAVFDQSRREVELQFRTFGSLNNPLAAAWRTLTSSFSWVWLLAALASGLSLRTRREWILGSSLFIVATFVAGVWTAPGGLILPRRFGEAAIAASCAYACLEAAYVRSLVPRVLAVALIGAVIGIMVSPACPGAIVCGTASLWSAFGTVVVGVGVTATHLSKNVHHRLSLLASLLTFLTATVLILRS
jgi:hypothetical protein